MAGAYSAQSHLRIFTVLRIDITDPIWYAYLGQHFNRLVHFLIHVLHIHHLNFWWGLLYFGDDIGNKKQNKLVKKDLKKPTSSLPVAIPKVKQPPPKIEVMDVEDVDEKLNKTVEMLSEISIPDGVGDIDAQDSENPQLCAEYAPAMYAYLRTLEEGLVIKKDFLKGCCVNGKMRGVLIDWLIEVHTQFKLLQETLYMTVYIIDKYLQVA